MGEFPLRGKVGDALEGLWSGDPEKGQHWKCKKKIIIREESVIISKHNYIFLFIISFICRLVTNPFSQYNISMEQTPFESE